MSAPDPLFRVLFVCTGNTCRSPLAQAALVRALGDTAAKVAVGSAGTAASDGAPASPPSRDVARRAGLDLEGHRSRRLNRDLLAAADLVLLMDPRVRAAASLSSERTSARSRGSMSNTRSAAASRSRVRRRLRCPARSRPACRATSREGGDAGAPSTAAVPAEPTITFAAVSPSARTRATWASGLRHVFPVQTNSTRKSGSGADMREV